MYKKLFAFALFWLSLFNVGQTFAQCPSCQASSGELVVNGNFAQGNTGFFSDYNGNPNPGPGLPILWDQGTYQIGTNANNFHYAFQGYAHSLPFFGNFMVVNGANVAGVNVWCQTVAVVPGGVYNFSAWVSSVHVDNPALLGFEINGQSVGNPFSAPPNTLNWQQHSTTWIAPAGVFTATICIESLNTDGGGNDFGLDDISFTGCAPVTILNTANAGPNLEICSGETVSIGVPSVQNINYSWSANPYFNNLTTANPSFAMTNSGLNPITYTFTLTSDSLSLGCVSTDEATVTVNPQPAHSLPPTVQSCELPLLLNAGNGATGYLWNTGETSSEIEVNNTGNFSVTVSSGNCSITANTQVSLITHQTADLGPDLLVCSLPIDIAANVNNANYLWSTGSTAQTISANNAGTYSIVLTHNGCESYDEIEVTFDQIYDFILQPALNVCTFPVTFNSNVVADTYEWSNGGSEPIVSFAEPGTYTLIAFEGECSGSRQIQVNLIPHALVDLQDSIIVCELPATIVTNIGGAEFYQWSNGDQTNEAIITEPGMYNVFVTDNGCPSSDEIFVSFLSLPEISLSKNYLILCDGEKEIVKATISNYDTYYWESEQENLEIVISTQGIETIYATNFCGTTEAEIEVIVEDCEHSLYIPNAFTPNEDGVNDLFEIVAVNFKESELWIYNRLGELVYYTSDLNQKWNGSGQQGEYYAHPEVFVYRFKGSTLLNKTIEQSGHVTVIR
jgi:gliding motility-associated-like protein